MPVTVDKIGKRYISSPILINGPFIFPCKMKDKEEG